MSITLYVLIALVGLPIAAPAAHAADEVDFSHDVVPILRTCTKCHSGPKKKGGLSIDTREKLLAGGKTAPGLVPGKPDDSELFLLVTETDADLRMPADADPLTKQQIETLRRLNASSP